MVNEENTKNDIYTVLGENPLIWGMFYCPEHFRMPSPPFHQKIILEAQRNRYLAIASPRESAKSTLLAFLYTIHCISYKKKHFVVIVSNTFTKSVHSLDTIKKELRDNPSLKDFQITITKDSEGDSVFTHPDGFETRVICKGAEQIGSIRGEKFGAWRPDLIIGDDIEDDELVRNPDRRRELQDVFDEALIPAGDHERCNFIFIGTILHDDSQMAKLVSKEYYPEYKKLLYKALNKTDNGEVSLWNEKWSVDDLKKLEREKPSVFAKEYQNDPVAGLLGKFHREDFRYWTIDNMDYVLFNEEGRVVAKDRLSTCKSAIACDLAWEEKRENDFTVILPGFLTQHNYILLDEYICKKGMRPHEIEEILFTMETRLRNLTGGSVVIGFEKAKLEKVTKHLLTQAMSRRNHWLIFKDLQWDADKTQRVITRLEPRYATHSIFHKRGMGELENQLLRFPSGTHDDLPDAEQGLCQLLIYPKGLIKPKPKEDKFEWWRKQAIEFKNPTKKSHIFGVKHLRRQMIPSIRGFD